MYTSGGPKWWLLYLGLAVFMILFIGEMEFPLPEIGHREVEVVLVLAAFGLTHQWLMQEIPATCSTGRAARPACSTSDPLALTSLPAKRSSSVKED